MVKVCTSEEQQVYSTAGEIHRDNISCQWVCVEKKKEKTSWVEEKMRITTPEKMRQGEVFSSQIYMSMIYSVVDNQSVRDKIMTQATIHHRIQKSDTSHHAM